MFTSFKTWFMSKSLAMILISILSTTMLWLSVEKVIIHTDMNSFLELPFSISIMIDNQSLMFISTVSTVSAMIIMYSFFYLKHESSYSMKKFTLILLTFIFSMFILSLSANSFWLLIGWDGLGISSFCLIIFYQNWKSMSSGMVTFLSNRMGDTLIIISMIWISINQSTDAWMFPESILTISFLLTLGAYSKSAQLPYLFWLPQAMAAPTPVSALVHSSTLVTAGIFLICRFQPTQQPICSNFFFTVSCITVMIAGSSSLVESDLKKVIALSTLCHISLMMMFSILGEINLSLFHLMMHAFFKSMLFMIAGIIIHMNNNSQDIRLISIPKGELSISLPFTISILSMMGFPFLSGFYSKEALLTSAPFHLPSMLMMLMFLANSFFSCAYSTRLMTLLFSNQMKKMTTMESNTFKNIMMMSSMMSSFMGGLLMYFLLPEESSIQSPLAKILLLVTSISGMVTGAAVSMKNKTIAYSLNELWKSNFMYKVFQKHFFLSSHFIMWMTDEKGTIKNTYTSIVNKAKNLFYYFSATFLKEPFSSMKLYHCAIVLIMMWIL